MSLVLSACFIYLIENLRVTRSKPKSYSQVQGGLPHFLIEVKVPSELHLPHVISTIRYHGNPIKICAEKIRELGRGKRKTENRP